MKKVAKKRVNWKRIAKLAQMRVSVESTACSVMKTLADHLAASRDEAIKRAEAAEKHNAILLKCNKASEFERNHWMQAYENCSKTHYPRPSPSRWQRLKERIGL